MTTRALVLAGLALLVPQTGQPPPRIFDVTAAHGVADGKPVRPGDLFSADDEVIYVWFRYEGCPSGGTITSDWYYLGSEPPIHLMEGRAVVGASSDSGHFKLDLGPGARWPAGGYRVDLRADGTLEAEALFRVVERTDAP